MESMATSSIFCDPDTEYEIYEWISIYEGNGGLQLVV